MESFNSFLSNLSNLPQEEELCQSLEHYTDLKWVQQDKGPILTGRNPKNNKSVSIKLINSPTIEKLETSKRVLKALQTIQHPSIVPLYDIHTSANEEPYLLYYSTDFDEGALSDALLEKKKFSFLQALSIFHSIAHALFTAKVRFGLFHGHIKPSNIFLINETYKIGNFETSQGKKESKGSVDLSMENIRGYFYLAPEQIDTELNETQNIDQFACDVYSLGILGLEIFGLDTHAIRSVSPKHPIYQQELQEMIQVMKKEISFDVGALIKSMLALDQFNRPSLEKVVESLSIILEKYDEESPRKKEIEEALDIVEKAEVFYEKSDFKNSLECFQQFLMVLQKWNGKPSDIAYVYDKLGVVKLALGHLDESFEDLKAALRISKSIYGPFQSEVADTQLSIARIHLLKERPDEAFKTAIDALTAYQDSLGRDSAEEAQVLILLGHIYKAKKDLEQAKKATERGLQIIKSHKGKAEEDSPATADVLELLGTISCGLKEYDKGLHYHQQALAIRISTLSSNHHRIVNSYRCLGDTYGQLNDPKKSIALYEMALKVMQLNYSKDHPEYLSLQVDIAQQYLKTGNHKKALEVLKDLESQLQNKVNGKLIQRTFIALANTYKAAGNSKKYEEYLAKASKCTENGV